MNKTVTLSLAAALFTAWQAAANPAPSLEQLDEALGRELLWRNNDIGKADRVLRGFEPVECDFNGNTLDIKVKNRVYRYQETLFPGSITARGQSILKNPIMLKSNGQALVERAEVRLLRSSETAAEYLTTATNGQIRFSVHSTIEFDGFIWNRLIVAPEKGAPVLESLELDIDFNPQQAFYLERHGVYEEKNDPVQVMPEHADWGFSCSVWLGNDETGLCVCAESDQNWDARTGHEKQIELKRLDDGSRRLRLKFIKAPKTLAKPLVLEFGLLATPAKDLPAGWRTISHFWSPQISWSWSRCFGGGWDTAMYDSYLNGRFQTDGKDGTYLYSSGRYYSPVPVPSCDDRRLFPEYLLYERRIAEVTKGGYAGFMQNKPLRTSFNPNEYRCGSIAGELGELFLYNMREAVRKYKLHFIYIDALGARPNMNPLQNAGYVDENGERQPAVAIRAARDIARRFYAMLDEESGGNFAIQIHGWDAMAPVLPYFTSRLDGEGYISEIGNKGHYSEVVPMELWRGSHRARAHGVIGVFLPELVGANHRIRAFSEELVMFLLLHDMPSDRKMTHYKVREASYGAMAGYGMQNLEFKPFWKNDHPAFSSDPEIKVSAYVDPSAPARGIIIVGNLGKKHKITDLTLDYPGWKKAGKLRDISNNCTIDVKDGKAVFPITALNFRILVPEF